VQTLSEIRQLLAAAGRGPRTERGQHFLIDGNLMRKLLELADLGGSETVLEVGAGTGSLTEELLQRARRVVAVELDAGLARILQDRLGAAEGLAVVRGDALAGKHVLSPAVVEAVAGAEELHLVANLPYSAAVPIIMNCLFATWRAVHGRGGPRFDRLTFTVQRELADRLTSPPGPAAYGPASVIVALLARATVGSAVPPQAFWPRPRVHSQMLRLDFDAASAGRLRDADVLAAVLAGAFGQRRKQLRSAVRVKGFRLPAAEFLSAVAGAGIDPACRAQEVSPEGFVAVANALSCNG